MRRLNVVTHPKAAETLSRIPYLQVQVLLSLNSAAANVDTIISNIFTCCRESGFLAPTQKAVHAVNVAML